MSKGKELIAHLIASKKVVVVSKSWCGYCGTAKTVLKSYDIDDDDIAIIEIDGGSDEREIQAYMGQLTGRTSVPRVFIGGEFIGGGDETAKMHKNGKLRQKLAAAGAIKS